MSGRLMYGPAKEPEGQPEETPPGGQPEDDPGTTPKVRKIGPLGFAGIGSMVLGVTALGASIPLAIRPDEWRPVAEGSERRTTHHAPGRARVGRRGQCRARDGRGPPRAGRGPAQASAHGLADS